MWVTFGVERSTPLCHISPPLVHGWGGALKIEDFTQFWNINGPQWCIPWLIFGKFLWFVGSISVTNYKQEAPLSLMDRTTCYVSKCMLSCTRHESYKSFNQQK